MGIFSVFNSFCMEKSLLEQLPRALQIQIFALTGEDLANVSLTCKYLHALLNNEQTIFEILKQNPPQEKVTNESKVGWFNNKIKEIWFNSVKNKDMEKAQLLITIVDPNVYDLNQCTVLEYAAINDRDPKIVKWLLNNGADSNKVTKCLFIAPLEKRLKLWKETYTNPEIKQAYRDILSLIQEKIEQDKEKENEKYLEDCFTDLVLSNP